jgi:hypothetical protein
MKLLPKTIIQYQDRFGDLEENLNFNIYLKDKYKTFENLCSVCLKKGKSIKELEPVLTKMDAG